MAHLVKSRGYNLSVLAKFPPLALVNHGLLIIAIHLIGSMTLFLSTCSRCVVSALAPMSCDSRRIIQVDAAHWWWLRRDPHMIVTRFGCTAIHNKALYKCIIHSFKVQIRPDYNLPKKSKKPDHF